MSKSQVLLNNYNADEALRVGDFTLLPINPKPPIITSHPHRNLAQSTYPSFFTPGATQQNAGGVPSGGPAPLISVFNKFYIRRGTALSWIMFVLDPSNINNPADTTNITYTWKRDGIPIYSLNRQNNGKGTPSVNYTEAEVTEELSGEYICEVSNEYGIVNTVPFVLDIINLDNHKSFFTNLINNGDGDGGLDNWIDLDGAFRTDIVSKETLTAADSTISDFSATTGSGATPPYPFRFNALSQNYLFYPVYYKLVQANPGFTDITNTIPTNPSDTPNGIEEWDWWFQTTAIPPVISNEDLNNYKSVQGFFPGPAWIDRYNNNTEAKSSAGYQTLLDELGLNAPNTSYFTRNNIKFGDPDPVTLQQSINITDAAPFIDNQVAGVDFITGQFFAYVGLAISKYIIRYTEKGVGKSINWYVKDITTYRRYLEGVANATRKITPDEGTSIEVVPVADDTIKIRLEYLDSVGNNIGLPVEVPTPTITDLWAAKEKVYFPLTLYPIFAFFNPANNPITVFGTKYTHTDALLPLMINETSSTDTDSQVAEINVQIAFIANSITNLTIFINLVDGWRATIQAYADLKAQADADKDSGITQDQLKAAEEAKQEAEERLAQVNQQTGQSNNDMYEPRKITRSQRIQQQARLEAQKEFIQSDPGKQIYAGTSALDPSRISSAALEPGLDRNAAFLMSRYGQGYTRNNRIYPDAVWEPIVNDFGDVFFEDAIKVPGVRYKALSDPGASAFFAVQNQTTIPRGTRLVRVSIIAQHSSEARTDTQAKAKGWQSDEIYNTLYNVGQNDPATNQAPPTSFPLYTYRNPRCGITKIKFQLIPNSETRSSKHITYELPPINNTVIGLATDMLSSDVMDTSQPGPFVYNLIMPEYPQTQPNNVEGDEESMNIKNEYEIFEKGPKTSQPNTQQPKNEIRTRDLE